MFGVHCKHVEIHVVGVGGELELLVGCGYEATAIREVDAHTLEFALEPSATPLCHPGGDRLSAGSQTMSKGAVADNESGDEFVLQVACQVGQAERHILCVPRMADLGFISAFYETCGTLTCGSRQVWFPRRGGSYIYIYI
jgi:hypothetical protein